MHKITLITGLTLAVAITPAAARYRLVDDYRPGNFFDGFAFYNETDPTAGTVVYDSFADASADSLIAYTNYSTVMGVDHTNIVANGQGRPSIRLTSNKAYNHGLFIADVLHMPPSTCGLWPALWLVGPDWPANGEIDLIEGVNMQTTNAMTLHTSEGCAMTGTGSWNSSSSSSNKNSNKNNLNPRNTYTAEMLGNLSTTSCWTDDPDQSTNAGCQITAPDASIHPQVGNANALAGTTVPQTYGTGLNAQSGAVVAMEWTSAAITIWLWPRAHLPPSIVAATNLSHTDTSGLALDAADKDWGTPLAVFGGSGCALDDHFKELQIVVNIDFCGSWAGESAVWASEQREGEGSCQEVTKTDCASWVRENPGEFEEAYWEFGAFRWFEERGDGDGNGNGTTVGSAAGATNTTITTMSATNSTTSATNTPKPSKKSCTTKPHTRTPVATNSTNSTNTTMSATNTTTSATNPTTTSKKSCTKRRRANTRTPAPPFKNSTSRFQRSNVPKPRIDGSRPITTPEAHRLRLGSGGDLHTGLAGVLTSGAARLGGGIGVVVVAAVLAGWAGS